MTPKDKNEVYERDQQRETARLLAEAKQRAAKRKPNVTQGHVDALWTVMTDETRATVALMATHRLGIRPASWPK